MAALLASIPDCYHPIRHRLDESLKRNYYLDVEYVRIRWYLFRKSGRKFVNSNPLSESVCICIKHKVTGLERTKLTKI
jgi:hypothetical protein